MYDRGFANIIPTKRSEYKGIFDMYLRGPSALAGQHHIPSISQCYIPSLFRYLVQLNLPLDEIFGEFYVMFEAQLLPVSSAC